MNTAVSAMMELVNELYAFTEKGERSAQAGKVAREAIESLIVMLSPFAPHTMEELWQMYGHADGLMPPRWPSFDAEVAKAEELEIPVQVNGKLRGVVDGAAVDHRRRAREGGAGRRQCPGAHRRQDGEESRDRQE